MTSFEIAYSWHRNVRRTEKSISNYGSTFWW